MLISDNFLKKFTKKAEGFFFRWGLIMASLKEW